MDQIWSRIDAWLAANAPDVLRSLHSGASEEDIRQTEVLLSVELPEDVRSSYRLHGGQSFVGPGLINTREFLSLERIRDEWKIWKDLLDNGDFEGSQSAPRDGCIKIDWWNPRWIPLTYDGAGNHDCLDLDPAPDGNLGQIIEFWHDDPDRRVRAPSFRAWFHKLADDLESGEYVLTDEYNGLIRRDEL